MTRFVPNAECEFCGTPGLMQCRYERYSPELQTWQAFLFCDGACCQTWLRMRNRLPHLGISRPPSVTEPAAQTRDSETT